MKLLKYCFYRYYQLMNKVGNADVAEYSAIILMSMMAFLNLCSLVLLINVILNIKIDISQSPKLIILLIYFGLLIIFYFLFIRRERYLAIAKEYEHETSKKKNIGYVFAIVYILMSIVVLMFSFFLMMQKNKGLL